MKDLMNYQLTSDKATDLIEDARNATIFVGASMEKLLTHTDDYPLHEHGEIQKGLAQVISWIDKALKEANTALM